MNQVLRILTVLAALIFVSTAEAHLVTRPHCGSLKCRATSQTENLAHARYVCKHGKQAHQRWSCRAVVWIERELNETQTARKPKLSLREWIRQHDPCSYEIIDRETAGTWDPTIWNYAGSGAYGWPQALPAEKMASAGPDWRTNPATQYRWMKEYCRTRYGGTCAALAYHNANGHY